MFKFIIGVIFFAEMIFHLVLMIIAPKDSLSYTNAMIGFFGYTILFYMTLYSDEKDD